MTKRHGDSTLGIARTLTLAALPSASSVGSRSTWAEGEGLTETRKGIMDETHETITTTTETVTSAHPDRYARNDPGSFASGEEQTPEKDADERLHDPGSFASGEEQTPEEDAAAQAHPGNFADTESHA